MEPCFWHAYFARHAPPPPAAPTPRRRPVAAEYTVDLILLHTAPIAVHCSAPLPGATSAAEASRMASALVRQRGAGVVGVVKYRGEPLCGGALVRYE